MYAIRSYYDVVEHRQTLKQREVLERAADAELRITSYNVCYTKLLRDSRRFWDEVCIDNEFLRGVTQKRLHSVPWRWVRQPVASEDAEEIETLYLEGSTAPGAPPGHRFPSYNFV